MSTKRLDASGGDISTIKKAGKLYGVGLGPGDPELMTLRAAALVSDADVIAYPTLAGAKSFARSIAQDHIPNGVTEIAIDIPMTVDRKPAQEAYDLGAAEITKMLETGRDVVCLCEGDPFFYGSFMYIFARLSGAFDVEVVPGVTSVSASAARAGLPLVARNERLTILPGPLVADELRMRIEGAESVAIMKVGRHKAKIGRIVDELGLTQSAIYVERVGLSDERVCPLSEAPERAPYFSMILIIKGGDPWL